MEVSASRYSTSVSASGGGNAASGGGVSRTDDDAGLAEEGSDAAGWLSLPHATIAGAHANSAAATAATTAGRHRTFELINPWQAPPAAAPWRRTSTPSSHRVHRARTSRAG